MPGLWGTCCLCVLGRWVRLLPVTCATSGHVVYGTFSYWFLACFFFSVYLTQSHRPSEVLSLEWVCSSFLGVRTGRYWALSCGRGWDEVEGGHLRPGETSWAQLSSDSYLPLSLCDHTLPGSTGETMRDVESSQKRGLPFLFPPEVMERRPVVGTGRYRVNAF